MEAKWQRKVDALKRLAEDQAGKPEGELARQKMQEIITKYSARLAERPSSHQAPNVDPHFNPYFFYSGMNFSYENRPMSDEFIKRVLEEMKVDVSAAFREVVMRAVDETLKADSNSPISGNTRA